MRFKTSSLIGLSSIFGAWLYYVETKVSLADVTIFFKLLAVYLLTLLSSGSLNLFNDVIDVNIDKELKPERILAQGTISIKKAYLFFFSLVVICFVLSFSLNFVIFIIYTIMLCIGISYSIFFENIPLFKNFIVGFSISMSIIVGYLSLIINGNFMLSGKVIIIFILSLFSILTFELQKDINDAEVDKKFNKNTFPVVFGKKLSAILAYTIYWILVVILWSYLLFVEVGANIFLVLLLIIFQTYVLFSVRNIISNQTFSVLERARIRIYLLFTITLFTLFII